MMTCNAKQRVERTGVSHDGVGQVELRYIHRDKDGKGITMIVVSPEDLWPGIDKTRAVNRQNCPDS